jgi:hypothetical protein
MCEIAGSARDLKRADVTLKADQARLQVADRQLILDPVGIRDAVGIELWGAGGDVVQQTAEAIGCRQIARGGAGAWLR